MIRRSLWIFSMTAALIVTHCASQVDAFHHHRGRGQSSNGCGGYSGYRGGQYGGGYAMNAQYSSYGSNAGCGGNVVYSSNVGYSGNSGCGCNGGQSNYYGMQSSSQSYGYANGSRMPMQSNAMAPNGTGQTTYYYAPPAGYGSGPTSSAQVAGTTTMSARNSVSTEVQSPFPADKIPAAPNSAAAVASPPQPGSLPSLGTSR